MDTFRIVEFIRRSHGYVYVTAGVVKGFFADHSDAVMCALSLRSVSHRDVFVCGCEIVVE